MVVDSCELIRNFINARVSDPNPSRTAGTQICVSNYPYFTNLTLNDFPKIDTLHQKRDQSTFSLGTTQLYSTETISISVFAKPDQVLSGFEGFNIVRKLVSDIENAFVQYAISDLISNGNFLMLNGLDSSTPARRNEYNLIQQDIILSMIKIVE